MRKSAIDLVLAVCVVLALGCAGCKNSGAGCGMVAVPKVRQGGQFDAGTAAQYPNPCEIDLDFGTVAAGERVAAVIEILNTGSCPLDLASTDPILDAGFGLDYGIQQEIEPGSFDAFTVSFEPMGPGMVTSTFTIQTDGVNSECRPNADGYTDVSVVLAGTGG